MKRILLIVLSIWLCSVNLSAQQKAPDDPIGKSFFPPEIIMQNQEAINLTESQRNNINKEIQSAQSEFMNLQWDLAKESEKLKSLIDNEKPSEKDVLEQLEKVLSIENKIKKRQISLLIRIKTVLSHEQQEKLQQLRGKGN
jgi:Spy/CpxP family protein refolding chaperone